MLVISCRKMTPKKMPVILPTPPVVLVPPMTMAAMMVISQPTKEVGWPALMWPLRMTPVRPEVRPLRTNTSVLTLSTCTPIIAAASSLPPMA